jgi:protoporphyrinogen oxidase
MVSVYFVDTARFRCLDATDDELRARAIAAIARAFPESASSVELAYVVRWPAAIAQFPRGRLGQLVTLRRRLDAWSGAVDVAGDWLDGVASESAVRTGQQAADRVARRLAA